jgi:hypothetical protein
LEYINLDKLTEVLEQYDSIFDVFSTILTPENFSELKRHRGNIDQHIDDFRATLPAPSNSTDDDNERKISLSGVDVSDTYSCTNNVTDLFSEITTITLEQLKQIEWDAADLHLTISLADAEKMQAYFSGADISEDHLHICRKLGKISIQMQQSYVSDPRPFDEEKTSDTQGPAHLLSQIYGGYLKRHNEETGHKARTSKVKKSAKKTRSDNKSTSKPKKKTEKTEKNIKPKQKSRSETKKPIEPKTLDESQTLNEEARQQIKDANALIRRKNEELNNTQQ